MRALLKNRCVVYTAITGNYDHLRAVPGNISRHADCVAFVDEKTLGAQTSAGNWRLAELADRGGDPCRSAKYCKILPHRTFPTHRYSLWIDGSVRVDFNFSIDALIEKYLSDCDLCIFPHPSRNCVYQEAEACLVQRKDAAGLIRRQVHRYRMEGYPPEAGMVEASVILRRHTAEVALFNESWWREIEAGSRRDQLSFNYCARRGNLEYNLFPRTLRVDNGLFSRAGHRHEIER